MNNIKYILLIICVLLLWNLLWEKTEKRISNYNILFTNINLNNKINYCKIKWIFYRKSDSFKVYLIDASGKNVNSHGYSRTSRVLSNHHVDDKNGSNNANLTNKKKPFWFLQLKNTLESSTPDRETHNESFASWKKANLSSALQRSLDAYCNGRRARCYNNFTQCFCSPVTYNYYRYQGAKNCLDNCGSFVRCHNYIDRYDTVAIPTHIIYNFMKITCVVSHAQKLLDNMCGFNKVMRFDNGKTYCIPFEMLDMKLVGNYCKDDSKNEIRCFGFFDKAKLGVFGTGYIENFEVQDQSDIDMFLKTPCVETMVSQHGEDYAGCQNHSIFNRKCLHWNSVKSDSSIVRSMKHNFCRNPEGLSTIYCYVNNNGNIVREHCQPRYITLQNNISIQQNAKPFSFDVTIMNVNDFRIALHSTSCGSTTTHNLTHSSDPFYSPNMYKYHELFGEIALTISFPEAKIPLNNSKNRTLIICACFDNYYNPKFSQCNPESFT